MWLAFDIGENINSLLALTKEDCMRQINPDTKEPEYVIILDKDNLKRSRSARSERTNYKETVEFLDIVLSDLKNSDKTITNRYVTNKKMSEMHDKNKLFKFQDSSAVKFLKRAVKLAEVRCESKGQEVSWKDLRSSMACDLLMKEWTTDEINKRLGHKPSSRMIDKYATFLAIDKRPQRKVYDSNIKKLEEELIQQREVNKLQTMRIESIKNEQEVFREELLDKFEQKALKEIKLKLGIK